MCESGDHVTLSRRCSVRVYSPDLACLLKVVAPRTADSSYLLHQGCSPTAAMELADPFLRHRHPRQPELSTPLDRGPQARNGAVQSDPRWPQG